MSENTKIAWCDSTWNPWIGCTKVDAGCARCYAETLMDKRRHRVKWGKGNPRSLTSDAYWKQPLAWNKRPWICDGCGRTGLGDKYGNLTTGMCECRGTTTFHRRRVFCASLADWLDDEVPTEWLARLLVLIHATPNIDWLLLSKRPEKWKERIARASGFQQAENGGVNDTSITILAWLQGSYAPKNVWIGTSVSDQESADKRIPELLKIPAAARFISYEPALGPVDFNPWLYKVGCEPHCGDKCSKDIDCPMERINAIHQIIVGGESGPGARPFNIEWARSTIKQCQAAGLAAFCKQVGALPTTDHPDRDGWPPGTGFSLPVADQRIIRLKDKKGGNMLEWPDALRVRQWPKGRP